MRRQPWVAQQGRTLVMPLLIIVLMSLAVLAAVTVKPTPPATSASTRLSEAPHTEAPQVIRRLQALGFENLTLLPGPKAGWHAVSTHQGLYYMDEAGEFLIAGQWFVVADSDNVVNLTEQANAQMRVAELKGLQNSAIVFGDADARYQVSVFTDHTCGYCRRMHQALGEYQAADIAVHYYAFPRAGAQSQGAKELASIWCADDPAAAMDLAKAGGDISELAAPSAACTEQVETHLQVGRALGVQGTPAIVLPDGRLLTGFRGAEALRSELEKSL